MPNVNAPHGFKVTRHLSGGEIRANLYRKEASVILGLGDPVVLTGAGSIAGTNNADKSGVPLVTRATAGSTNTMTGIVVDVFIDGASAPDLNSQAKHMAAADTGYVLVVDDPLVLVEAQEDSVGSNLGSSDPGQGLSFVISNADTATGISNAMLDSSDIATGTQLQVLRLLDKPDNAVGQYGVYECRINRHTFLANATLI